MNMSSARVVTLTAVVGLQVLNAQTPTNEFLISEGKAGPIEVGMPVDDVLQVYGRERIRIVDLNREGFFTPAIEIDVPGSSVRAALIADIREWPCATFSVTGIRVRDPRFRTADGFGVGSTLAEIQRRKTVRISREEGWSAILADAKIAFGLEAVGATDAARVASVWLSLDPTKVRAQRCPNR
jgi:hypothetical protein